MSDNIDIDGIPQDIIDAAHKIQDYMTQNGYCEYWELGPVCDRRFADRFRVVDDQIQRAIRAAQTNMNPTFFGQPVPYGYRPNGPI